MAYEGFVDSEPEQGLLRDNGVFMIEGILFLNGVLMRLFGLFLDTIGVLTTVGVFIIDLVLVSGLAAGLFTGVAIVGFSRTFLDFHCFSGLRSGSRPFCAP